MLEFIIGRAGSGKTHYCLESMRQAMQAAPEGPALFLILPEHMTFKVERELAESQGLDGFSRSYVFGFRRLARQILLETGGAAYPRISDVGKRLLLSKVLANCSADFQVLGRASRQRNFAASLTGMMEEFKSYGLSAASLQQAAAVMPAGELKDKLADLTAVYQGVCDEMQGRYNDAEDMLAALEAQIPAAALLENAEIWIDGFVFFNPQELAILQALLQKARQVHITLCLGNPADPENSSETALFHRQWQTYSKVRRLAEALGTSCHTRLLAGSPRFAEKSLAHIEQNLFHFPPRALATESGLQLVEAANRRLEIEAVAADILRLCREKAFRWRDIGILVRDGESYDNVFDAVFRDYGIPFFSDAKRRSVHHPLAELLRSALEARRGWKYEPLFRCFKTDFFPVTRTQIDLLENYALAFGIRGKRWTMAEDWTYHKRLSIDAAEIDEKQGQELAEINHIRHLVMEPLLRFAAHMQQAASVQQQTEAIYEFLLELGVPETLGKWAQTAEKAGDLAEAREHEQIWNDIMDLFDQLAETSGAEQMTGDAYEAIINDGLDGLQISLIPPGLDYVTLAPFDQSSLDNSRAIYIVGASEGSMPRRARPEGLLSDADRQQLAAVGLELAAGCSSDNFAEKYLLYRGFTLAREYLWVSYPLADGDGSGLNPSPLVRRLREILPQASAVSLPLEDLFGDEKRFVAEGRQAVSKLATALRLCREEGKLNPFWQDVYNWALQEKDLQKLLQRITAGLFATARTDRLPPALAQQLYAKNKRLRGSVTRFERFRACPFQHFAQYGLSLKERAEYRFAAPDLGTLLHASLKAFGEKMQAENRRWSEVDAAECRMICGAIVQELAPKLQNEILLSSAQYQHLLSRIQRTVERAVGRLIGFAGVSEFQPVGLEKSFGSGQEALPPLTYDLADGYKLEIIGQIDRIDQAGSRFLIIDYKSGKAYLNLIDVYYGLQLQLLTYLLVAQNAANELFGRKTLPAGILYYFLKNPLLTQKYPLTAKEAEAAINKELKMPGWIVADPEIIRQIDSTSKYIKVLLKTDGTINASTRSQVKSEAEFMALLSYIDGVLAETGQDILSGAIAISPYRFDAQKEACTYCSYHAVCQFDRMLPGSEYRQLKKLDEGTLLQNILEEVSACPGPKHK